MAKVIANPFGSMRGKLAGMVFSAARDGIDTVRALVTPRNPDTTRQRLVRKAFKSLVTMMGRNRQSLFGIWDAYAKDSPIKGENGVSAFVRLNALNVQQLWTSQNFPTETTAQLDTSQKILLAKTLLWYPQRGVTPVSFDGTPSYDPNSKSLTVNWQTVLPGGNDDDVVYIGVYEPEFDSDVSVYSMDGNVPALLIFRGDTRDTGTATVNSGIALSSPVVFLFVMEAGTPADNTALSGQYLNSASTPALQAQIPIS